MKISKEMNIATKGIHTDGKVTLNLSKIYNDLLPMLNLPPPLYANTSTFQNASNIIIGSGCEPDVYLDGYDKKLLSISKDLQCPQNPANLTEPNKPLRINLK